MVEVQYGAQGRMKYHPNHKKPYTTRELAYVCKYYGFGKVKAIALALGRTESTIRQLVNTLRKNGVFEKYKDMEVCIIAVEAKVKFELNEEQKLQFQNVRENEGEQEAFYFLEEMIMKEIDLAEFVEMEYKDEK